MAEKKPNWEKLIYASVAVVLAAVTGFVTNWLTPAKVVEKTVVKADAEYAPTQGWVRDEDQIALNQNPLLTTQFAGTPAGRALLAGDEDVYLWRAVRKAAGKPTDWYPNVNQRNVGCCVGCGFKHSVDVLQAVQIAQGRAADWKPVSAEAIYAFSRVEIGGGRISGDGSVGAWAKNAVRDKGVLAMEAHGGIDLTVFDPARARAWGRSGVPDELEPTAAKNLVRTTALVTSWADVDRAIRQGYPVAVCSDQGFRMERDRDGFCSRQGTWYHCMAIVGVRGGARPGGFVLNSWGDSAHTGAVFPADAPAAGFWADAATIDRMVRQGDSFALSDVQGFPQRRPAPDDWFIRGEVAPRRWGRDAFALLKPDWSLSP